MPLSLLSIVSLLLARRNLPFSAPLLQGRGWGGAFELDAALVERPHPRPLP